VDRSEGSNREGKVITDTGLLVPAESIGLHDVFGVGIEESPVQDALKLGEGVLESGGDAVAGPEADEPCVGMDVGVEDRFAEVHLYGHGRIVARKEHVEAMNALDAGVRMLGFGRRVEQSREVGDLDGEGVGIAREAEATGVRLREGFEEEPLVVDSACTHGPEVSAVSRW
jgi:hypothetical protein